MRLYLESARTPLRFERGERVRVRCGIARFPYEAPFPPRSWVERAYEVVHWTDMSRGGHFAAREALMISRPTSFSSSEKSSASH
jgi:hypothetical protein